MPTIPTSSGGLSIIPKVPTYVYSKVVPKGSSSTFPPKQCFFERSVASFKQGIFGVSALNQEKLWNLKEFLK
jgi:hypothetical protein